MVPVNKLVNMLKFNVTGRDINEIFFTLIASLRQSSRVLCDGFSSAIARDIILSTCSANGLASPLKPPESRIKLNRWCCLWAHSQVVLFAIAI
jgi:hypothetical protein